VHVAEKNWEAKLKSSKTNRKKKSSNAAEIAHLNGIRRI